MVELKPYVHWKINNDVANYDDIDSNYLWATIVETNKGPINTPVICESAAQVSRIFGVDVRAYFAQGASYLVVVRAAAESQDAKFSYSTVSIATASDFVYKKVIQPRYQKTVDGETVDNGPKKYALDGTTKIPVNNIAGSSVKFQACDATTGVIPEPEENVTPKTYGYNEVYDTKEQEEVTIPAGTPVITIDAKFPGDYPLSLVLYQNLTSNGYNITLEEENNGYVSINNATDLINIVNRINDANLNAYASLTEKGAEIAEITRASPKIADSEFSNVAIGQILALDANTPKYTVELQDVDAGAFQLGSNGEWDDANQRVSEDYRVKAHKEALESLRLLNIAGIACLYGEDTIQREYLLHGNDPSDPYVGMNSNIVCKWRYIVIGANDIDRDSIIALKDKAASIDDQYVLFMGQGLIDGNTILKPYECTLYLAGLRAKLHYGDSIFGGQSRKAIKPVSTRLRIAPLLAYEDAIIWEPLTYTELNEAGVLTFTSEYGQLTFTDGVTTRQSGNEEDEEGVVNILKYIQHGVQNICTRYIGRNINSDLQAGLEMSIATFLESMTSGDQTLIALPDEGIPAYEVEVVMNPRSTQLVGKIYVYLKVTPVHALRQIEVEMTVQ